MICKECGKEIPETVKSCPNCGYEDKTQKTMFLILTIIEIVIVLISLVTLITPNGNVEDYKVLYGSESNGNTIYLFEMVQKGGILICIIGLLACIGLKNKYKKATVISYIFIGLLVLCQMIPVISNICVKITI